MNNISSLKQSFSPSERGLGGVYIHESSYVDEGSQIGKGTKIWHFSHIMSGCTIGDCKIQNNVSVYTGVRCEDDVFLGPSMVFTNVINPRAAVSRKDEYKPTVLKRGCSVGANATIVCGHTLGEYCLIGAGSVVTKDVLPFALMVGNPARRIGWVSRHGEKLQFDADGRAVCPATGEKYLLQDGTVKVICQDVPTDEEKPESPTDHYRVDYLA